MRHALHAGLDEQPLTARCRAAHHPSFVVEVAEHDVDTCALFAERVPDGDAHIGEGDVGCAGGGGVTGLDRLGLDTFASGYENDSEAVLRRN